MATEQAIERCSERFGLFPRGFKSYRSTLIEMTMMCEPILSNKDDMKMLTNIDVIMMDHGSSHVHSALHEWAVEYEESSRKGIVDMEDFFNLKNRLA